MMVNIQKYEELAARLLKSYGGASVSVGVLSGGERFFFSAGHGDLEAQACPGAHTVYQIGSCTKSFTAAAVCLLAQEGRIELDAPVRRYIPELEMANDTLTCQLTLRDALCHRPGLPPNSFAWLPFLDRYDEHKLLGQLQLCKPAAPFRTQMIYSNQMYMLCGRVIERVSGMKWGDFIRERFLIPLGMTETYTDPLGLPDLHDVSRPYEMLDGHLTRVPYSCIHAMSPAGSMASTTADLLKWIDFHLNRGQVNGKQLIDWTLMEQCHALQIAIPNGSFDFLGMERKRQMGYGFGWFVENYAGHTVVQHGGNIDGYSAMLSFAPEDDCGVAVLINTGHCMLNETLPYYLYDEKIGLPFEDHGEKVLQWYQAMEAQDTPAPAMQNVPDLPAFPAHTLAGVYQDELYGQLEIIEKDGGITGQLGMYTLLFEHVNGGGYWVRVPMLTGNAPFPAVFHTDVYGRICSVCIEWESPVTYQKQ